MLVSKYNKTWNDAISAHLWRQWGELGVAAHGSSTGAGLTLDPEALVLFSAAFCRRCPRLYDLMANWLLTYGALINTTRLKALQKKARYKDTESMAYLAALCAQAGDKRWLRFADADTAPEEQTLFAAEDGTDLSYYRTRDELAARYGLIRPAFQRQHKIMRRIPHTAATLLLRLRGGLGVSARAEVMLLLMQGVHSTQQMADVSGFARGAVKDVLAELELGNIISAAKISECRQAYILNNAQSLKEFYGVSQVCFPRWFAIYESLGAVLQLLANPVLARLSSETLQGQIHLLLNNTLRPRLIQCGVPALQALEEDYMDTLPRILESLGTSESL